MKRFSQSAIPIVIMISLIAYSPFAFADGTNGVSFPNPLKYDSLSALLTAFLEKLQGVVGVIAVVFIVIGGIMYMMSGGSPDMIKRAKAAILASLIGLAIVLAGPAFLKEVRSILGANDGVATDTTITNAPSLYTIAHNVLTFLLSVAGILAIIAMVIGGVMYLTSYGDEDQAKRAKAIVKYALIGIGSALAALVLVEQVGTLIGS